MMLKALANKIMDEWELGSANQDSYQYMVEYVGNLIKDLDSSRPYIRELVCDHMLTEFSEAIEHGFDDFAGFTFFYTVKYLVHSLNILQEMNKRRQQPR